MRRGARAKPLVQLQAPGTSLTIVHRRTLALVPAFDAEASIGAVVQQLRAVWPGADPRVVVVDDGSRDRTAHVARDAGAHVVRHAVNRGKGAALRTGMVEAHRLGASHVVSVDADGQHLADEARRLVDHAAPEAALVLGVRDLVRDGAPRPNIISNGISNFFLSWFSGRRLLDTQCGLRRYPVAGTLALGARDDGYAFEAEIVLRAAHAGWVIALEPVRVHYPPEHERVTHFDSVRDPARIVRRVVATLWSTRAPMSGGAP
jgi:glycosyltransferase involved in cell wall biosynthesis